MAAQIELTDDIFMASGCWSGGNYISLMVTLCQMTIASSQNPIPLPGRKNGKAEGKRDKLAKSFPFQRVLLEASHSDFCFYLISQDYFPWLPSL